MSTGHASDRRSQRELALATFSLFSICAMVLSTSGWPSAPLVALGVAAGLALAYADRLGPLASVGRWMERDGDLLLPVVGVAMVVVVGVVLAFRLSVGPLVEVGLGWLIGLFAAQLSGA